MNQIKPTQITPEEIKRSNPNIPLPRDLKSRAAIDSTKVDQVSSAPTPISMDQSVVFSEEEAPLAQLIPQTPVILSIKSQNIGFQPDGTSKVDVVLEVQNVEHAVEYEVRVAKSAGTL